MTKDVFRIDLQARDPALNRRRFYIIEAGRDLFGDLLVTLHYGRIGTHGHAKTFIAPNTAAGIKPVRACRKRRQIAAKRIGVAYEVLGKFDPNNWADF